MYIVEYFKINGAVVQLEVTDTLKLKEITQTLTDRVILGSVISFNVEVIDTNISMGK